MTKEVDSGPLHINSSITLLAMLGESAQDVVAEPIFGFEFDVQGGCTYINFILVVELAKLCENQYTVICNIVIKS